MAIDRGLLESFLAGSAGPVFRLYTWRPPAISLGAHQDPDRDIDRAAARARGVDVVVRPTGGRAIYHDEELTYAIVAAVNDPVFGGSIRESHAAVSRVFQAALARVGIRAELGSSPGSGAGVAGDRVAVRRADGAGGGTAGAPSAPAPCFASTTRTELVVRGRKILGSAQRRTGGAFLQHGSLLTGDAHLNLVDFLPASPEVRSRARADLERRTTTVAREAGRVVPLAELIAATGEALGGLLGREGVTFVTWSPST